MNQSQNSNIDKWDEYYENYSKKSTVVSIIEWANRNYFTPMFTRRLYSIVHKNKGLKILEPGCGSGLMSSILAKNNNITVMDLSVKALDISKINFNKKNVKGEFVKGDLFKMPFDEDSFDVVWNQGVLEHFKNPVIAMKEMLRVTKKEGYVVIFIPAFLSPLHIVWIILKTLGLKKLWPIDEQDFFSAKSFKKYMKNAGYKNPKVKRLWIRSLNFSQVGYCKKIM